MTKVEELKKLLKENIKELKDFIYLNISEIDFKGDEVIVLNRDNKVIFKDLIKNYDTTFESQKKFIFNVLNRVTSFVRDYSNIDWENEKKLILSEDECNMVDVVGIGDIYKNNFVKIDEKLTNYLYLINIIRKIRREFCNRGLVIVYCKDKKGFYVDGITHKNEICIKYINEFNNIVGRKVTLYYRITSDRKIKKAIKFIENLLKEVKDDKSQEAELTPFCFNLQLKWQNLMLYKSYLKLKEADKAVEFIKNLLNKKG